MPRYRSRNPATPRHAPSPYAPLKRDGDDCFYCAAIGHRYRGCPVLASDLQHKVVEWDTNGRYICLPGGRQIPSFVHAKCIRDRAVLYQYQLDTFHPEALAAEPAAPVTAHTSTSTATPVVPAPCASAASAPTVDHDGMWSTCASPSHTDTAHGTDAVRSTSPDSLFSANYSPSPIFGPLVESDDELDNLHFTYPTDGPADGTYCTTFAGATPGPNVNDSDDAQISSLLDTMATSVLTWDWLHDWDWELALAIRYIHLSGRTIPDLAERYLEIHGCAASPINFA
ncbi:hypothetical protein C8F01DRAFT_1266671 [Mycena amicta]|nr:hypothetical protein C8F01DRAFT_1266671 [Mycena amicta]